MPDSSPARPPTSSSSAGELRSSGGLGSWLALAALLVVFATLSLRGAWSSSATFDEVAHLPAGVSYWAAGDARLNREHPPLVKLLAALPAVVADSQVPLDRASWAEGDQWRFGSELLFTSGNDPGWILGAGRTVCVAIGLLAGLLIFLWCRAMVGARAALLPSLLFCLSPLFIAHSALVTTDVATAAALLVLAWSAWRSLERDGWRSLLLAGMGAAALMLCKYTGPIGVGAVLLALLLRTTWRDPASRRRGVLALVAVSGAALLAATLVWGWPPSLRAYPDGFASLGFNHMAGWRFYALGQFSEQARWWYFPFALAVKAAPGTLMSLALVAILAAAAARRALPAPGAGWPFFLLPALGYGLAVVVGAPNVGVRYLLPALALALPAAGFLPALLGERLRSGLVQIVLALVVGGQVWAAWSARDLPLAWFNGLAGCTTGQALPCLDDSNVDWGQALPALAEELGRVAPKDRVRLAYFGTARVGHYLDSVAMGAAEVERPYRALYALSVQRMLRPPGGQEQALEEYWFHQREADMVVAGVYHIFDLREVAGLPAPPRAEPAP